jgi:hypothetical protein
MRALLIAACILAAAAAANGQTSPGRPGQAIEAGVLLADGCFGSGGSTCREHGTAAGGYGSLWLNASAEVGFRVARIGRGDWESRIARDGRFTRALSEAGRSLTHVDARRTGRRRILANALVAYHFRRGTGLRPFAGLLFGERIDRSRNTCEPAGCEELLDLLIGPGEVRGGDLGPLAGLGGTSGRLAGPRLDARAPPGCRERAAADRPARQRGMLLEETRATPYHALRAMALHWARGARRSPLCSAR